MNYSKNPALIKVMSKTFKSGLGVKVLTKVVFPILLLVKIVLYEERGGVAGCGAIGDERWV